MPQALAACTRHEQPATCGARMQQLGATGNWQPCMRPNHAAGGVVASAVTHGFKPTWQHNVTVNPIAAREAARAASTRRVRQLQSGPCGLRCAHAAVRSRVRSRVQCTQRCHPRRSRGPSPLGMWPAAAWLPLSGRPVHGHSELKAALPATPSLRSSTRPCEQDFLEGMVGGSREAPV
jgi:hypothetical protein